MNILLLLQICIVSLCFCGGNSLVGAYAQQQPKVTLKFICGNSGQYDLNAAVLCMEMIKQNLDGCGVNMEKVYAS